MKACYTLILMAFILCLLPVKYALSGTTIPIQIEVVNTLKSPFSINTQTSSSIGCSQVVNKLGSMKVPQGRHRYTYSCVNNNTPLIMFSITGSKYQIDFHGYLPLSPLNDAEFTCSKNLLCYYNLSNNRISLAIIVLN